MRSEDVRLVRVAKMNAERVVKLRVPGVLAADSELIGWESFGPDPDVAAALVVDMLWGPGT